MKCQRQVNIHIWVSVYHVTNEVNMSKNVCSKIISKTKLLKAGVTRQTNNLIIISEIPNTIFINCTLISSGWVVHESSTRTLLHPVEPSIQLPLSKSFYSWHLSNISMLVLIIPSLFTLMSKCCKLDKEQFIVQPLISFIYYWRYMWNHSHDLTKPFYFLFSVFLIIYVFFIVILKQLFVRYILFIII